MEISNILLLLLSLIPIMYLCVHKLRNQPSINVNDARSFRLPPGSTGFPLIGETLSYYLRIRLGRQYEFLEERMDKFSSKIFRTSLIGEPIAMLCGAEGNKFVFSNENKLVRVWYPSRLDKLFPHSNSNQPSGEHVKWLRDMVFPCIFKADVLREHLGVMDALMKQHLETYWTGKNVVKVGEMAKKYTLTLACNFFLGINDLSKIDEFVQGMDAIEAAFFGMPSNFPGTAMNRGIKASKVMRSKIEAIIRQRKMDPSINHSSTSSVKDLMSHMLLEIDENGEFIKEGDIASYLLAFMLAGHSTLHATITMVLACLAEHSGLYDSVLEEQEEIASLNESRDRLSWEDIRKMKNSWNIVCEVLRLYTSKSVGFREAITDFTYEGYTIPKGWKIHWMSHATHMNPKYFDDPGKFDPSRFDGKDPAPYAFVPFGAGSRMCPGYEYARLAILTFIHRVVTEFRWEKLVPGEKVLQYPHIRPAQGLPVRLYPHRV